MPEATFPILQLLGPSTGGIRRVVASLTEVLRERGWPIEVAAPPGVLDDGDVRADHHVEVPAATPGGLLRLPAARGALARHVPAGGLVHAHGLKAAVLASTLRPRPPLVATVHNLVLEEAAGAAAPALRAVEAQLPRMVDHLICVSREIADRFGGVGDRVTVVPPWGPPPVPRRDPTAVRKSLGVDVDAPLVVSVARYHPQKDLPTLVQAASLLRDKVPGVRVVLVGEGPLDDELRALVAAGGLNATVTFVPPGNPADEMAAADVVAISSLWESGPLVLLEAMQLARPVVTTDVGFVPDVVDDGRTGLVVPTRDPVRLADALADVLRDRTRAAAMGRAAAEAMAARRDPATLVGPIEDAYRATMSRR